MYQANQKAVIQNANINLVGIRQSEIQYYAQFFTNFGTQCFLLAGFLAGSISQTPTLEYNCDYFWVVLYNTSVALCLAITCHVLIATVFLVVYGQGLAIRGPIGSMVKVVEGMVQEQHKIVGYFIASIITFSLSMVGMYFIMMDEAYAILSAIIAGVGGMYTYHCALRIYNRFFWDESKSGWKYDHEIDAENELDDLNPILVNELVGKNYTNEEISEAYKALLGSEQLNEQDTNEKKKTAILDYLAKKRPAVAPMTSAASVSGDNPRHPAANNPASSASTTSTPPRKSILKAPSLKGMLNSVTGRGKGLATLEEEEGLETPYVDMDSMPSVTTAGAASNSTTASPNTVRSGNVVANSAGYLSVKMDKRTLLGHDLYERRYFIIRSTLMYYYKDKTAFAKEPHNPLNKRPIDLEGYSLVAESSSPPYTVLLVPIDTEDIRKVWKFRCDTESEYTQWKVMLGDAIPKANANIAAVIADDAE
jgi:hypothetical protein